MSGVEYRELTEEQRRDLLTQRVLQLEAAHFNLQLEIRQALAVGDEDAAATHRDSAAQLEIQIAALRGEDG